MSFLNIQRFLEIFDRKIPHLQLQNAFKTFQKKYKASFSFDSLNSVIQRINKTNKRETQKNHFQPIDKELEGAQSFVFGEFKIFTWVLVVYCQNYDLALEELNEGHFGEIQSIFQSKSLIFIKYETLCLVHERQKFQKDWSAAEVTLLTHVVSLKNLPNQWRVISFEVFKHSEGAYYRPFQQYREKWFNYLDPRVNRGEWTEDQDIVLLTAAEFLGCKWAMISRELGGARTEHMVKNRYKSLISKWKKKFKKSNPQKLLSYILKQLKKKCLTKQQLNFSNQQIFQDNSISHIDKQEHFQKIIPYELIQPNNQICEMKHVSQQKIEKKCAQSEFKNGQKLDQDFGLGLGNNQGQRQWNLDIQTSEDKLLINYMRYKNQNFVWQLEKKDQRKTSENQQEEKLQKGKNEQAEELQLFQSYNMFQPQENHPRVENLLWQSPSRFWVLNQQQHSVEDQWFCNLQEKNFLSWMDDSI